MNGYLFSVIVPVYNVETCLERCVDSILAQEQTEGQIEILLIDDGSTDGSGVLCDRLAERFSVVKAVHKENGGLSSARNAGIEMAKGDYVLFVDSDDFIEKHTCRLLEQAIKKYSCPDALSFDGWEDNGRRRTPIRRLPIEVLKCTKDGKTYLLEHYKERNLNVEAWLYAYRRGFLFEQNLRFAEGILHEDVEFTPRALLVCKRIVELPDCLYHYVIRENSISTQKNREKNIKDLFCTLEKQVLLAGQQESELKKWMKDAALDSYLNMVQEARMYQKQYRKLLKKSFLPGKAATNWNRFRVLLCFVSVRLYCFMNDCYKRLRV
ncbi:MAG TPA: glycosyl transferase family 2 [Lachnospiraceae bacterium]|nr:glycosyl transferase family 2 [Lachnospiraceae bacterium]